MKFWSLSLRKTSCHSHVTQCNSQSFPWVDYLCKGLAWCISCHGLLTNYFKHTGPRVFTSSKGLDTEPINALRLRKSKGRKGKQCLQPEQTQTHSLSILSDTTWLHHILFSWFALSVDTWVRVTCQGLPEERVFHVLGQCSTWLAHLVFCLLLASYCWKNEPYSDLNYMYNTLS